MPDRFSEPDVGSREWKERHKHDRYKINRLKYGCGIHGILPSIGPDACLYANRCDFPGDPAVGHLCHRGWPCPREEAYFKAFVMDARRQFIRSRRWLTDEEFESTIRDLALHDLQKVRCSARLRDEGFVRTVRRERPDGLTEVAQIPTLGDRYGTAAHRGFGKALMTLLIDPNPPEPEEPVPVWKRDQDAMERFRRAEELEKIEKLLNVDLD